MTTYTNQTIHYSFRISFDILFAFISLVILLFDILFVLIQ